MIIDDDSGEETIYQTEKEGGEDFPPGQGQGGSPRGKPPTPDQAPALGKGKKWNGDHCVGRIREHTNPTHEFHRINRYKASESFYVKIFHKDANGSSKPLHIYPRKVPGNAILYVEKDDNGDREIVWRYEGIHT